MIDYLTSQFKPDIASVNIKKIFCILEGKDELLFVKRLYELNFGTVECEVFTKDKITLQWGKEKTILNDNINCNFQGGNLKDCGTPMPVIEALNNSNFSIYDGLIVMYDKDCDEENYVKEQIETILGDNHDYIAYISNPCFEKEVLMIIKDSTTKQYINTNYQIIEDLKCLWFKRNFGKVPKQKRYNFYQKCESATSHLNISDIRNNIFANYTMEYIGEKLR